MPYTREAKPQALTLLQRAVWIWNQKLHLPKTANVTRGREKKLLRFRLKWLKSHEDQVPMIMG